MLYFISLMYLTFFFIILYSFKIIINHRIFTGIFFLKQLKYNINNPAIALKIKFYDPIDISNRPWIKYYLFNNTDTTIKKNVIV